MTLKMLKPNEQMNYRFVMVKDAKRGSIKETARTFNTSPKVVRKWVKRFDTDRLNSLNDRSRRPNFKPNK